MSNNLGNMQRKGAECFPWVPAELAPFSGQHHKWSWSWPEWSAARTPLCADSIRNNCILASFHHPPTHSFTTTVWHLTVFLCCKLQYDLRAREGTLQHHSCARSNIHIPLDCMKSCTEPPLRLKKKKYFSAAFGFKVTTGLFNRATKVTKVSLPHFL